MPFLLKLSNFFLCQIIGVVVWLFCKNRANNFPSRLNLLAKFQILTVSMVVIPHFCIDVKLCTFIGAMCHPCRMKNPLLDSAVSMWYSYISIDIDRYFTKYLDIDWYRYRYTRHCSRTEWCEDPVQRLPIPLPAINGIQKKCLHLS